MPASPLIAYVTCPDKAAAEVIAHELVKKRHAACVNIIPGLVSIYRWQNKIESDEEHLLMIKTTDRAFEQLQETVLANHPDELPEIVAVPIAHGLPGYLDWIAQETTME